MRQWAGAHRRRITIGTSFVLGGACMPTGGAAALSLRQVADAMGAVEPASFGPFAVSLGLLMVALTAGALLAGLRSRSSRRERALRGEIAGLRARLHWSETLFAGERQTVIVFGGPDEEPDISGDLALHLGLPVGRRLLGFGLWVAPDDAGALERRTETLRERGEAFEMSVATRTGHYVQVEGRAVAGRAVLRIRDLSGDRRALAELKSTHAELQGAFARLEGLLDALPEPAWLRDTLGRLVWTNAAYARAVEAESPAAAAGQAMELLDRPLREEAALRRSASEVFRKRLPAVVAGERRMFDVHEVPAGGGAAGLAIDVSELEEARADLVRRIKAHRRTLDELATGVAIFRADGRLTFYNQAYRKLWGLDPAFLDQEATDSGILDRLRANRDLPEQADFRAWKAQLHEAYRAMDAREHWWHLPDGRTLRVVQAPNPEGGVTYLFDDVSERLDLESRYNALIRVQTETLDNLREGVAFFGSDGRLRLHNPAFARMWKLPPDELALHPHAERVFALCRVLHDEDEPWNALKLAVTALQYGRTPLTARMERGDRSVIDVATVPLPDGATLVTFSDVSAAMAIERALKERNDALEAADHLKNAFVKHVSYELRSPLTTIIGFSQLLGEPATGPLDGRQREYVGHIVSSSTALLAIINDILDLATIDAGAMELDLGEVDIRATMEAAVEGVRDRVAEAGISLNIEAAPGIGAFVADGKRVRQVLYNLLSNAIGFSPPGAVVTLAAERTRDAVTFRVEDQGEGMAEELAARVFDRFENHTGKSGHRGVGLGLSIVRSFVELHGGRVCLDTVAGGGTTVTCTFPLDGSVAQVAAE